MRLKKANYFDNGKPLERWVEVYNMKDIIDDELLLKIMGYSNYRDFMVANGAKRSITEKRAKKMVYRMMVLTMECIRDELLTGTPVSFYNTVTFQLAEAKPCQRRQLIHYFEKDYALVNKTYKHFINSYKRLIYVFPTNKMKLLILKVLKNGKSFETCSWLQ